MMINPWQEKRVLIIGAARQGLALARYLNRKGAQVILNDKTPAEQMVSARAALADLPIEWILGEHPLSLLERVDVVCLSGGIPLSLPIVVAARQRGLPLTNDSQIFMQVAPCPVIGITGSAGKTTTTTLVGRMALAAMQGPRKSWIGGNIGLPLIDLVEQISPEDIVVLELSSFQLEQMTLSPQIAVVLNITPNHLDRHKNLEAYTAAKANILTHQTSSDIAILNREDAGSWALTHQVRGKLLSFGLNRPAADQNGSYLENGMICMQDNSVRSELLPQTIIQLRGEHNLLNTLAACTIAYAAGFSSDAIGSGIQGFGGVVHRLELVRTLQGASWYNDSIATAPERSMAALRSFSEPIVLLLGGRDKDLPWEDLAEMVHQRVDHVIVFGEAAQKILKALGPQQTSQRPYTLQRCTGLQEAVEAAANIVDPGDVVLLSPGGTSFDEFKDFEERGERFREWVNQLS